MNSPLPVDPRQVRQQGNDINELYGLVDAMRTDMTNEFAAMNTRLDELNTKVDDGFAEMKRLLTQALGGSGTA